MTAIKNDILQRDAEAFFRAEAELRAGFAALQPEQIAAGLVAFHKGIVQAKPNAEQYRELAAQFTLTLTQQQRPLVGGALNNGVIVRAAVRAGLLPGLAEDAIGEMKPGAVLRLANDITDALRVAFELPGE